jgi:hypothetical protein
VAVSARRAVGRRCYRASSWRPRTNRRGGAAGHRSGCSCETARPGLDTLARRHGGGQFANSRRPGGGRRDRPSVEPRGASPRWSIGPIWPRLPPAPPRSTSRICADSHLRPAAARHASERGTDLTQGDAWRASLTGRGAAGRPDRRRADFGVRSRMCSPAARRWADDPRAAGQLDQADYRGAPPAGRQPDAVYVGVRYEVGGSWAAAEGPRVPARRGDPVQPGVPAQARHGAEDGTCRTWGRTRGDRARRDGSRGFAGVRRRPAARLTAYTAAMVVPTPSDGRGAGAHHARPSGTPSRRRGSPTPSGPVVSIGTATSSVGRFHLPDPRRRLTTRRRWSRGASRPGHDSRLTCAARADDRGGSPATGGVRALHAAACSATLTDESGHYAYGWLLASTPAPRPALRQQQDAVLSERAAPEARRGGLPPGPCAAIWNDRVQPVRDGACATLRGGCLLGPALYGGAGVPRPRACVFDPNILAMADSSPPISTRRDDRAGGVGLLAVLNHRGWGAGGRRRQRQPRGHGEVHGGVSGADPDPDRARARGAGARRWRAGTGALPGGWAGGGVRGAHVTAFLVVVNLGTGARRHSRSPSTSGRASSSGQAALAPVPGSGSRCRAYVASTVLMTSAPRTGTSTSWGRWVGRGGGGDSRVLPVAWLYKEPIATQLPALALVVYALRLAVDSPERWFLAAPRSSSWYRRHLPDADRYRHAPSSAAALRLHGSLLPEAAALGGDPAGGRLLVYLVVSVLSYYPHFIRTSRAVWTGRGLPGAGGLEPRADRTSGTCAAISGSTPRSFEPDSLWRGLSWCGSSDAWAVFVERFRWLRENFEPVDHVAHEHPVPHPNAPARDRPRADRRSGQGLLTRTRLSPRGVDARGLIRPLTLPPLAPYPTPYHAVSGRRPDGLLRLLL